MTGTTIDLAGPAIWGSRFPEDLFAELRARTPVFHQRLTDDVRSTVGREFWVCTKHADVARVHRDHESFTATRGPLIQDVPLFDAYPAIVSMDPPDHTIRRKVIARAFTPRAVAKLEAGIRDRARAMAATLRESGGGEFVDLAAGLPISVIGDIVGIPDADRPRVFGLIDRVLKTAGAQMSVPDGDDLLPFMELFEYASELTAYKREHPVDDIWSALCTTEITSESGQSFLLPANELEIFFFILGLAGADTTRNALCDGLRAFVANPDQIAVYRSDPDARRTAVEEVIRYSTPIMFWVRGAIRDVVLADVTIPEGARVVTMLRSANRDEDVFEDPYRFDIRRDPNPHQSFGGGGAHHCLGAMLARAEVRAALDEVLLKSGDIELGEPRMTLPDLCNNMTVYESLPVRLGRG
ncbi:cytochrome P450 [Mycobacterium paraseoulense]|uniref:Cytochrome n=1 Tax=Mycobacterium paraseoulense TaxID=590652 RepID=A0A1X0I4U9_9MYCO|nr:cytochrome P450 [Mycobacterium paraseoulense]MCV7394662.1 cytochrome P450 [Mycobacterium paraseoulense]ORB34774.1 cytochrome [Mycobacterium paraseoulense]BBZ73592.1 cytochrome P450 [Mycobacterium paraseoulense]